jgi:hypothetical protein
MGLYTLEELVRKWQHEQGNGEWRIENAECRMPDRPGRASRKGAKSAKVRAEDGVSQQRPHGRGSSECPLVPIFIPLR